MSLKELLTYNVVPQLKEVMRPDGFFFETITVSRQGQKSGPQNLHLDVSAQSLGDSRLNLFSAGNHRFRSALYINFNAHTADWVSQLIEQFRNDPAVRFNAPRVIKATGEPLFTAGITWRGSEDIAKSSHNQRLPEDLVDFFVHGSRVLLLKASNTAPNSVWPESVAIPAPALRSKLDPDAAEKIAHYCRDDVEHIFKK